MRQNIRTCAKNVGLCRLLRRPTDVIILYDVMHVSKVRLFSRPAELATATGDMAEGPFFDIGNRARAFCAVRQEYESIRKTPARAEPGPTSAVRMLPAPILPGLVWGILSTRSVWCHQPGKTINSGRCDLARVAPACDDGRDEVAQLGVYRLDIDRQVVCAEGFRRRGTDRRDNSAGVESGA